MSDPIMAKAVRVLDELSADPVARRLAQEREEGRLPYEMDLAEARRLGAVEGREQGRAEALAEAARKLLASGMAEHAVGELLGIDLDAVHAATR
jgi:flagellar biosynthesis/type III secretory pathway protein FliH